LITAIGSANLVPASLRLTAKCVYPHAARLPQITGTVDLVGGPPTTLTVGTNTGFRILDVTANAPRRTRGSSQERERRRQRVRRRDPERRNSAANLGG
jgi:hypothetical protein